MTEENQTPQSELAPLRKFEDLPAPAQRALKEAEERRLKLAAKTAERAKEVGGRGGEDPARFGDWEVKGIAIDF
ncbi:MAG: DUF1674 domain-containing protein [Ahrensia sp.]|nr:DUF1674 domain-containing protein [Ahrensia sp.]